MSAAQPKSTAAKTERRGSVLEMLRELLQEQRTEEVVALVAKLVTRNSELERLLAQAKAGKGKKNEGVPTSTAATAPRWPSGQQQRHAGRGRCEVEEHLRHR